MGIFDFFTEKNGRIGKPIEMKKNIKHIKKINKKEIKLSKIKKKSKGATKLEEIKDGGERKAEILKKKEIKKGIIKSRSFLKTHIPGFDSLLGEGIPEGNAILVEGGPGNGKTIFCLNLVKTMCEKGKKVLYMSFEEPEERLLTHMEIFGAKPLDYKKKGILYVKRFNALDIARSVEALLSEAKKELLIDVQPVLIPPEFKPDIVLVDSLSSISSAFSGESSRFRIYMEQLFRYLEGHKITSFLIREVSNPNHVGGNFVEPGEAVSFLSDGIIVLYNVFHKDGHRSRALEILKLRGSDISRKIVEFEIKGNQGIHVYPDKVLKGDYILT